MFEPFIEGSDGLPLWSCHDELFVGMCFLDDIITVCSDVGAVATPPQCPLKLVADGNLVRLSWVLLYTKT